MRKTTHTVGHVRPFFFNPFVNVTDRPKKEQLVLPNISRIHGFFSSLIKLAFVNVFNLFMALTAKYTLTVFAKHNIFSGDGWFMR